MDLGKIKEEFPEVPIGTRTEDLTNKRFYDWIALYRTTNKGEKVRWVCECQLCGKIKPVLKFSLTSGRSQNCGCEREKIKREKKSQQVRHFDENGKLIEKHCFRCKRWLPIDNFWKNRAQLDGYTNECKNCYNTAKESRYNIYRKGARKRNLDFNLSKEEFYNLTSSACYYCGQIQGHNGIDRVNSLLGYTTENCVPCCEMCNRMKLDYTLENWLKQIHLIYYHMKGKAKND